MRAARPTWMPTTTPGSELFSSRLQEHPALDSVDTVPSVRGPGWRQSSGPASSLKTDSRRSYGKSLL